MRNRHSTTGATIGATALMAEEGESPEIGCERPLHRLVVTPRAVSETRDAALSAFRNWSKIRARLRVAKRFAFFLDFDGTLVNLRLRPGDVRMPRAAKMVLRRLAAHENVQVAIVSGRKRNNVRRLVSVSGIRYFGVHGGERDEDSVSLSAKSRRALEGAKHAAQRELKSIPGVWIQDKGLSVAIHYRESDRHSARLAGEFLAGLLEPWGDALHILNGSRVWEILPQEVPGKFTAVDDVLGAHRPATAVVYIGNDGTDEVAFAALPDDITIRVGREPLTQARYFVRTPAEVVRLLARMEEELP
jgi:trehalose 6-phosphate phosphatase